MQLVQIVVKSEPWPWTWLGQPEVLCTPLSPLSLTPCPRLPWPRCPCCPMGPAHRAWLVSCKTVFVTLSLQLPRQPCGAKRPGSLCGGMRKVTVCQGQGGLWGEVDYACWDSPHYPSPQPRGASCPSGLPTDPQMVTPQVARTGWAGAVRSCEGYPLGILGRPYSKNKGSRS